jgi:adenylyltransferase/sulfurtransferase
MVPSCAEGGVLGVLPGLVGTLQATEALKLILGVGEPLIGRLLLVNALGAQWRTVKVRKNPLCPACGTHEISALIDYDEFCGITPALNDAMARVPEITPSEVAAKLARGENFDFIDVREPHEEKIARIEGARLVPLGSFEAEIPALDPNREIVVSCRSGSRSAKAVQRLQAAGFTKVWNLAGGILRWSDEVDPTIVKY